MLIVRRNEKLEGKLPKPRKAAVLFSALTDRALKHAEPSGKGVYHYRMNILQAKFDDMPAEEIKPAEVDAWLEEHTEWSTASRNRYLALMKLVFRLAEYDGKIEKNPQGSPEE
jgi:hypothetical protein